MMGRDTFVHGQRNQCRESRPFSLKDFLEDGKQKRTDWKAAEGKRLHQRAELAEAEVNITS